MLAASCTPGENVNARGKGGSFDRPSGVPKLGVEVQGLENGVVAARGRRFGTIGELLIGLSRSNMDRGRLRERCNGWPGLAKRQAEIGRGGEWRKEGVREGSYGDAGGITRVGLAGAGRSSGGADPPFKGVRGAAGTVASSSRFKMVSWLPSFLVPALPEARLFSSKRVSVKTRKAKVNQTRTIRCSATRAFDDVSAAIGHCYFVLLEDMAAPHALGIDACVRPATKSASEARLLAFGPSLGPPVFQVLFLGGTPATRGLKDRRVWCRAGVNVVLVNVIVWVEEPVLVLGESGVRETLGILVLVGERGEGVANEDRVGV